MILRGVAHGARISADIARCLKLSRAQACQMHKAALLAKAVPVLTISRRATLKRQRSSLNEERVELHRHGSLA